jgi:SAM-dependent methyltransferase
MLDKPEWNAEQSERNRYVRFRTGYTFDRFVPLAVDGSYRILDFGCGLGHSLDALLERFPNSQFVAADYASHALDLCEQHFGADPRLQIVRMTGSTSLQEIGGGFDIIQLNAVFEHLLPDERTPLMSDLWRRLKAGGYLVVTETPWRWFPIETHCTSLPLVNYLPDRLALHAFRHCGRYPADSSLAHALRCGLRGGTVSEILASLSAGDGEAELVRSRRDDARDLLESWWHGECRQTRQKRFAYRVMSLVRSVTGLAVSPWVNIAISKSAS